MVSEIGNMAESLIDVAPDFADPFSVLLFCHQRMRDNLQLLQDLYRHARQKGMDEQARSACHQVWRYFCEAAPLHHLDEEADLFPQLIARDNNLCEIIAALKQQHGSVNALWQHLEPLLATPDQLLSASGVESRIDDFCQSYRTHLRTEEEQLLPHARKLLNQETLLMIGKQMRRRREAAHA